MTITRSHKGKGNCIAVHGTTSHSYGVSLAIWDHTVLPATRHKWTHPASHMLNTHLFAISLKQDSQVWYNYSKSLQCRVSLLIKYQIAVIGKLWDQCKSLSHIPEVTCYNFWFYLTDYLSKVTRGCDKFPKQDGLQDCWNRTNALPVPKTDTETH